jgi:hypothetical protein
VTCPNNVTRTISPRCTKARDCKSLTLHPHDGLQHGHRARAKDPGFIEIYRRKRPMVERSLAWLTRVARRGPYRGVRKNSAWLALRAAGLNLRRLLNLGLVGGTGTPAP